MHTGEALKKIIIVSESSHMRPCPRSEKNTFHTYDLKDYEINAVQRDDA